MENRNEKEENKDERTEKVNECPQLVNVIHIYIYTTGKNKYSSVF